MASKVAAQIGMDDKWIKDPELEELLEKRQELKAGVSEYRKADKDAKDKLKEVQTPVPFRIGRFIINKSERQAKEVSFEVGPSSSLNIKLVTE